MNKKKYAVRNIHDIMKKIKSFKRKERRDFYVEV